MSENPQARMVKDLLFGHVCEVCGEDLDDDQCANCDHKRELLRRWFQPSNTERNTNG